MSRAPHLVFFVVFYFVLLCITFASCSLVLVFFLCLFWVEGFEDSVYLASCSGHWIR